MLVRNGNVSEDLDDGQQCKWGGCRHIAIFREVEPKVVSHLITKLQITCEMSLKPHEISLDRYLN